MSCYYDASSTRFLDDMMQGDMNELYERFLEKMPERGIILDAGCGSGRDSLYFKTLGHMVVSMDTSEEICQYAGEQIGQSVLYCRFQDVTFKLLFDGIWACGSLLELSMPELDKVLKNFAWHLKDNGILYASFIYEADQDKPSIYLQLAEEEANHIFEEAGLSISKLWTTDHMVVGHTGKKWLNILAEKKN